MKRLTLILIGLAVLPWGQAAGGVIFEVNPFTDNGAYNDSEQLTLLVDVSEPTAGMVRFEFRNDSTAASSSIAGVYFDDGLAALGAPVIDNGSGVDFWHGASPPQLGGGLAFNTTYSAGPMRRPPHDGVNSGEHVGFNFTTAPWVDFDDIVSAMNDQTLRVGAHVIALPDGSSEWAVNTPDSVPVPEPATIALLVTGGLFVAAGRKKTA
ncbi:hypothetical protein STSP2_03106 [Anaerohalosphaera lusitana]|uniref:Ice-binding protein C-terminal domain-containing protein n=1 Tax=Anaerohalosphaera lusitana TaxID=1936003 RepID=A0A1U9NQX0_9BACT|nr:PEP-CTERM sorting domain-containing protein [Anaerohalosphaera lusitana]AQT69906.1 hypothetical protein STSP2_03106 [Anaerohalosphaera lusitana]